MLVGEEILERGTGARARRSQSEEKELTGGARKGKSRQVKKSTARGAIPKKVLQD